MPRLPTKGMVKKVQKAKPTPMQGVTKTYVSKPARILEPPHVPLQNRKPEKKAVDQAINQAFDSTGTVTALCIPAQGAGPNQRLGRQTELDNLYVTGYVTATGSATTDILPDLGRLLVVYDRSPVGSNPAISDIIQDLNAAGSTATSALSGVNLNNKKRFVILMDQRIFLPGAKGNTGTNPTIFAQDQSQSLVIKRFIKLGGLMQEYKSSTPGVADLTTGAIFLVTLSETTAAASTTIWKYLGFVRLNYRDA